MEPEENADDVEKKMKCDERERRGQKWPEFLIIPAVSKFSRADTRNHFRDQLLHFPDLTLKAVLTVGI